MNADPIGPTPSRADALGQLKRERWFANNVGETARVAQLDRQIAELSAANSAAPPTRETAAAKVPARQTAARTATPSPGAAKKTTEKKGTTRVRTAR